jgi:hypothetical protein
VLNPSSPHSTVPAQASLGGDFFEIAFGVAVFTSRRLRDEGELLDLRGLRGHSQPLAIALHKNISPDAVVAGFLAVFHGDFVVGAHCGRVSVGGLDLSRSFSFRLALAVRSDGGSVIGHDFFECCRIVTLLAIQPGPCSHTRTLPRDVSRNRQRQQLQAMRRAIPTPQPVPRCSNRPRIRKPPAG